MKERLQRVQRKMEEKYWSVFREDGTSQHTFESAMELKELLGLDNRLVLIGPEQLEVQCGHFGLMSHQARHHLFLRLFMHISLQKSTMGTSLGWSAQIAGFKPFMENFAYRPLSFSPFLSVNAMASLRD